MNVRNLLTRTQLVNYVINEFKQFQDEFAGREFYLLTKIDQLAFQTITDCTPFILLNQHTAIQAESKILVDQAIEFRNDGLKQGGDRKSVIHSCRNIANAKLERREIWMRPDVPP